MLTSGISVWRDAYVQLAGEAGKAGLAVDTGQDVEGELLGTLDDDMFALWIPTYHVVVLRTFKQTATDNE